MVIESFLENPTVQYYKRTTILGTFHYLQSIPHKGNWKLQGKQVGHKAPPNSQLISSTYVADSSQQMYLHPNTYEYNNDNTKNLPWMFGQIFFLCALN